jgi:hypothetical protein
MGVSPLKMDAGYTTDPREQVQILNKQYHSVFTQEDMVNIPDLGPSPHSMMPDLEFDENGIAKLLSGLNASKANGPDKVPIHILKSCSEHIAPVLRVIFTQSVKEADLPQDWRTAQITPIFKKGNRGEASNYRPVSLTSVVCKVLEHIVSHSIRSHLDSNNILVHYQHGFRSKHSTESQLIMTIEDIAKGMDEKHQLDAIVLDFPRHLTRWHIRGCLGN